MQQNYYAVEEAPEQDAEQPLFAGLTLRKISSIALILLVLIIALFLILNLLGQSNNPLFSDPNGGKIQGHSTLSKNGKLIDLFNSDGNILTLAGNPNNTIYSTLNTNNLIGGNRTIEYTIKDARGRITSIKVSPSDVFIDANGTIHFSLKPTEDMNLEEYYDENTSEYIFPNGGVVDLTFEFVITNDENETMIIEIPAEFIFQDFFQSGCIAFEKTSIRESTHFGVLELNTKMRVLCSVPESLLSNIEWQGERMGNIEVRFNDDYRTAAVLTPYAKPVYASISQGEYNVKIIFTPFTEYAGQTAAFFINFGLGQSLVKLDFAVAIDNLEQCIKLTPDKVVIPANVDFATLTIDVSSCASNKIEITLCDNNPNCAGGSEGGIDISQMYFSLTSGGSGSSKTIKISRGEIAGAYGASVHARAPGIEKVFVDDKLVIVEPNSDATIIPDKFVVSLIGGARDSIRIKNKTLAEEVPITASICSEYKSSLGITGDTSLGAAVTAYAGTTSWWRDLATNPDKYSGSGKYQASLINTLYAIDNVRAATQNVSAQKNALIKNAYLVGAGINAGMQTNSTNATAAITAANTLKDSANAINQYTEANLASQITALVTSIAAIATDIMTARVNFESVADRVAQEATLAGVDCQPAAVAGLTGASATMNGSKGFWTELYQESATALVTVNQIYSIYQQIVAFTERTETIDGETAVNQATLSQQKINEAWQRANNAEYYLKKALESASINSFTAASREDAEAVQYLILAQTEFGAAKTSLEAAIENQLIANDAITTAIAEMPSDSDLVIQATSLFVTLLSSLNLMQGYSATVNRNLDTATTQLTAASTAANAANETNFPLCKSYVGRIATIKSSVASVKAQTTSHYTRTLRAVSTVNTLYQAFQMYNSLTSTLSDDLTAANTAFTTLLSSMYTSQAAIIAGIAALPDAITAGQWLSAQEKDAALGSSYAEYFGLTFSDEFNKKRMSGLISTAIMNGFVNGAYVGGVYTTTNTFATGSASPIRTEENNSINSGKIYFEDTAITDNSNFVDLKEDCSNQISFTLPDYIINLVSDGKQINVSAPGVTAAWDHSDAKVFDVFNEQETGVLFANSGLKNNSYGVVEFNINKSNHEKPTALSGTDFGPFSITDSSVEPTIVKYHFKFNAAPRQGNNYTPLAGNDCVDGLLRGKNGNGGIPKVIMSWDWNSVRGVGSLAGAGIAQRSVSNAVVGGNSIDEPYLDATQLTILMSKKLGSLSNYLETVSPQCPENPAQKIFAAVRPTIPTSTGVPYTGEAPDATNFCYLPLTTKLYDGKPALYYFVKDSPMTSWEYFFSDTERVNDAQELLKLLDFNVNLMRDGYGIDFQYDFVNRFTTAIMQAGPSFMDPEQGARRYFSDKERIYYSSQANGFRSNNAWVLPDAGKYRVRFLIDFEDTAKVFDGSAPKARIVVELYSLEPVNSGYSPLYYMPIDGLVGLSAKDSRTNYGISINGGDTFDVGKNNGVYVDSQQKNSLVKVNYSKIEDYFILNALPSVRGKLLDVKYNYNPKTMRDDNSFIKYFPSVATPLLFEIQGVSGQQTFYTYSVKRNNQPINSTLNNMFLLSSVGQCTDLAGTPLSRFYYKAPDYGENKAYGVLLPVAQVSGKTFLKTIAYSPLMDSYELIKPVNGQIYTPSDLKGINNPVALNGITGMLYNDKSANSTTSSLTQILKGVEEKNVCVSSLGDREFFFWPEEKLYKENSLDGGSLSSLETNAIATCVK